MSAASDPRPALSTRGALFLAARRHAYLADEMRLGKSRQAIMAADMVGAENVVVVCPAIARVNWTREFAKHSINERHFTILTSERQEVPGTGFVVLSYDLARSPIIRAKLAARRFDLLLADEAHYLKNRRSLQTEAILGRDGLARICDRRWLLSGTPTPNGDPGELWAVLKTLHPEATSVNGFPLSYDDFMDRYTVRWKLNQTGHAIWKIRGLRRQEELRAALDGFMLRRTKEQVRPELPRMLFGEVAVETKPLDPSLECAVDDVETEELSTLRRHLAMLKVRPTAEFVRQEMDSGLKRLVIFAWHVDAIKALADELRGSGASVGTIHGATSGKRDQDTLDRFRTHDGAAIIIGQIKACGTAISMATADQALFLEQSWTPGDNAQALMRIEDPSKSYSCLTRFVIARGTLDEAVTATARRKGNWTKELIE